MRLSNSNIVFEKSVEIPEAVQQRNYEIYEEYGPYFFFNNFLFNRSNMKFVFSTRSPTPFILDEKGNHMFDIKSGYKFKPKKDELVREGTDGYIVTYGEKKKKKKN